MGVRFEVFGGVRVISAAGIVTLRPQAARVLGILLAEPATPVPVERIVDRLWRDEPPPTATKVVHVTVGRLRRALEESGWDRPRLRTTAAGYVLDTVPHDLDEYEHARTRVEALRVSRPDDALAAALAAHRAWRGRPWGDDADADWIADRVHALEERHRALTETWGDLLLEHGAPVDAIEAIRDAAAAEPLRERRWAQLMTALYRDGRQADALAAYERVRRLLRDELGIEPGPELRQLQLAVLQQDPVLLRSAPARAEAHSPTSFVGRDDELRALARAVARDRLVGVTGIGGIGKTRLADEFAHRCALTGEAVHRISFSGLESTDRFDDHAARQVGLFLDERSTLAPALAASVGGAPALVVIDAADLVADRVGNLALTLLELCPRVRVVVTSRIALGLGLEREFHLRGLPPAEPGAPIAGSDLELMLDRAGFDAATLGATTLDALRAACRTAGGIPLLIELAARTWHWDATDPRPTPVTPGPEPVREAITQALDAVDEPAQQLVTLGSVLPGGMTDTIGGGIVGAEPDAARRWLRQLAWVHLVDAFPGRRGVRYRSLDPIRSALLDGLGEAERERALEAATRTIRALVDCIWPDHTQGVVLAAVDAVADEHDNLRFLLADRLVHAPLDALELAIGASDYWALRGHMVEGRAWLREAMTAANPEGPLRWRATLALVRATRTMAEVSQLRDLLEATCTEAADTQESAIVLGGLLMYLAVARGWQGDRLGAARALDDAERIDDALGTPWSRANLDHLRAFDRALVGDFDGARAAQRVFATRMLELGDPVSAATGHYLAAALGDMTGREDVVPEVRDDLAAARELAETTGDVSLSCQILLLEARVLQRAHDARSRAVLVDAATRLAEQGGIRAAALARRDIGLLALNEREFAEAEEHLRAVAPVLLRLDRAASAPAWAGLAVLRARRGNHAIAAVLAGAARSLPVPDAPQWADDRARVQAILDGFTAGAEPASVSDDDLLTILAG